MKTPRSFSAIGNGIRARSAWFTILLGLAWLANATAAFAQAPTITAISAPRQVVSVTQSATLSVTATGATSYQWNRNGLPIPSATNSSYTITNAAPARDNGWYQVVVSNASGSTTSAVVFVNVAASSSVVSIGIGLLHTITLKPDGTVLASGDNSLGQLNVPAGLSDVVAVACGAYNTLAVKSDGTVVSWGYNSAGVPAGLNNVVAVASGDNHRLALKSDGTVVAWGGNSSGQTNVPVGLNAVAISAFGDHAMALRNDGTVVSWGDNAEGQATVPAGLTNVTSISAGGNHVVALKSDGTVVAWGRSVEGQTAIPAGLNNVVSVGAGSYHSVALKSDGTVVSWGASPPNKAFGRAYYLTAGALTTTGVFYTPTISITNPGHTVTGGQSISLSADVSSATTPTYQWLKNGHAISGATSLSYAIAAAATTDAGWYQLVATNGNGSTTSTAHFINVTPPRSSFVGWGGNAQGQLSSPSGLASYVSVAARGAHVLALKSDSTVVGWGSNSSGESTIPAGLTGIVAIAAGTIHGVALRAEGTLVAWGNNTSGQAVVPVNLGGVVAIAAGTSHTLALKGDGTVTAWGSNSLGQLNIPAGLSGVVAIAAGDNHSVALKDDGTVVAWGDNTNGAATVPVGLAGVARISAGGAHNLALKTDGTVVTWGRNVEGQATVPAGLSGVVKIVAGGLHSLALKSDGTMAAWGSNSSGQMTPPAGIPMAIEIAAGGDFSLALCLFPTFPVAAYPANFVNRGQNLTLNAPATGAVSYQWKRNGVPIAGATNSSYAITNAQPPMGLIWYQVVATNSIGATTSPTLFVNVVLDSCRIVGWGSDADLVISGPATVTSIAAISAGWRHVLVLKGDGTVAAWGYDGPNFFPGKDFRAVVPSGLTNVVAIGAGEESSHAFQTSGLVRGWGKSGNLSSSSPGADVAFSQGEHHTMFLKNDGTVEVIGSNLVGQLNIPAGTTGVVAIAAGADHCLALKGDGTVVAWGSNNFNGEATVPVGLANVTAIAAGYEHNLALKSDGTVVAWGRNNFGQTSVPAGLSGVVAVCTGLTNTSLAIKADGTVVAWGKNSSGQATVPAGLTDVVAVAVGQEFALAVSVASGGSTAPSIVTHPAAATVNQGQPVSFSVTATGSPVLTYQWQKNGTPIGSATNSTYTVSSAQPADTGNYSVVVTNSAGTATSSAASLTVVPTGATATHNGPGYVAGNMLTITNTFTYPGSAASAGWQVLLPSGWSYVSSAGNDGQTRPVVGTTNALEWAWTTVPPSPVTFTYTLNVPSGQTGDKELAALVTLRLGSDPIQLMALSDPLIIRPLTTHSGDEDRDFQISLFELTRVIELYNTRNGTTRTGAYRVQSGTEDGFAAEPSRLFGSTAVLSAYHSADSNRDGNISLFELTRVIELYNYRVGTVRTGQYHVQLGTEDNFAPGP